jgi:EAL and modified HD-GYP domain-containing signal transduction protein
VASSAGVQSVAGTSKQVFRFVARQPILNRDEQVFGYALLPSEQTVVEVLEDVEADDLVIAACERLKVAGYTVALDDFVANDPRESLTALADILKVDFERTTRAEQAALLKRYAPLGRRMLAEKVETRSSSWRRRTWGTFTFRDISFDVRKC